jgi:hypothetical protein
LQGNHAEQILITGSNAYLRHMRILLSLILLCCFFITPLESNAGSKSDNRTSVLKKKFSKAGVAGHLAGDDCAAVITPSGNSHSAVTRYKSFHFSNHLQAVCISCGRQLLAAEKYFAPTYTYCQPIGLKLLFPKHYFW